MEGGSGNPPLIDTDVLVYLFDADAPGKRRISKDLVSGIGAEPRGEVENPMPAEDVKRFITGIQEFCGWNVVGYGSKTILSAHGIRDALLAATMIEYGIGTIITEDAHLRRVPGITVINPYMQAGQVFRCCGRPGIWMVCAKPGMLQTIQRDRRYEAKTPISRPFIDTAC